MEEGKQSLSLVSPNRTEKEIVELIDLDSCSGGEKIVCDAVDDPNHKQHAAVIVFPESDKEAHYHPCWEHIPAPLGHVRVPEPSGMQFYCRLHEVDLAFKSLAEGPHFIQHDAGIWSYEFGEDSFCPGLEAELNRLKGTSEPTSEEEDAWYAEHDCSISWMLIYAKPQ